MKAPHLTLAPAVNTFRRSMQEFGISTSLAPVRESMKEALDASADAIAAQALREIAERFTDIELPPADIRNILLGFAKGLEP